MSSRSQNIVRLAIEQNRTKTNNPFVSSISSETSEIVENQENDEPPSRFDIESIVDADLIFVNVQILM